MIEEIDRRIAVAMARVRHALRATLSRLITSGPVALVQADALSGEQLQAAELMQHYGFTSAPPAGALLLVVPVGGRTAHGVVVADEHAAFRIRNLAQGEVAIYTDEGDHIRLKRGRVVEISTQTLNVIATTAVNITTPTLTVTAAAAVNLTTPTVQASAALKAAGQITDLSGSNVKTIADLRTIYNLHTHLEHDVGGQTEEPTQQI